MAASPPPAQQGYRLSQSQHYANQARNINGRAFYQNSASGPIPPPRKNPASPPSTSPSTARRGSTYSKKTQKPVPWLSLGSDIDVVIDNKLYQIRG